MNYSYFVGLDVGKKTFDASLMSADEKELSHKSFENTPDEPSSADSVIVRCPGVLSEVF